ncbi:hypothetical protein V6N13_027450 [Hibiscus sabdariffa]
MVLLNGNWLFVGQFIGAAPIFGAMQKIVDLLWGKVSKVKLYNVPLELFAKMGLSYIASALGSPLYMDSVTTNRERLEYAKMCVEIEACAKIPQFIDVLLRDGRVHPVRVDTVVTDAITRCASDFETIPDGQTDASPQTLVDNGSMLAEPVQTDLVADTMVVDGKLMLPMAADDVDFPTLQVLVQKKKGRGCLAKEKEDASQGALVQDLKNKKKASIDSAKVVVANVVGVVNSGVGNPPSLITC